MGLGRSRFGLVRDARKAMASVFAASLPVFSPCIHDLARGRLAGLHVGGLCGLLAGFEFALLTPEARFLSPPTVVQRENGLLRRVEL